MTEKVDTNLQETELLALSIIHGAMGIQIDEIKDMKLLKKGMTNRSFLFTYDDSKYIIRIPGEGTDRLINREEEAEVYRKIEGKNLSEELIYFNEKKGYKIAKYLCGARVCNPDNEEDVIKCMRILKNFHDMEIEVGHSFDVFQKIEFYQKLWGSEVSQYKDYFEIKEKIFLLKPYITLYSQRKVLSHIDAVPDNFLFIKDKGETETIKLIDWEYAGMQDPHIDIAMFCIYSSYNRKQVDKVIDIYFGGECDRNIRVKIYCYIAVCGLLWSNWCEYKIKFGIAFGEYAARQYQYAKEYLRIVQEELTDMGYNDVFH